MQERHEIEALERYDEYELHVLVGTSSTVLVRTDDTLRADEAACGSVEENVFVEPFGGAQQTRSVCSQVVAQVKSSLGAWLLSPWRAARRSF